MGDPVCQYSYRGIAFFEISLLSKLYPCTRCGSVSTRIGVSHFSRYRYYRNPTLVPDVGLSVPVSIGVSHFSRYLYYRNSVQVPAVGLSVPVFGYRIFGDIVTTETLPLYQMWVCQYQYRGIAFLEISLLPKLCPSTSCGSVSTRIEVSHFSRYRYYRNSVLVPAVGLSVPVLGYRIFGDIASIETLP